MGAIELLNQAKKMKGSHVSIGVHETEGSETYPNGAKVSEVAFWNEYGTVTAPERSFIRSTVDENRRMLNELTKKLLVKITKGDLTTEKALEKLGFLIQTKIQKKILELNDPKNAPRTIAAKGFNNPLVDSRRLWRSIAYQVVLKGGNL